MSNEVLFRCLAAVAAIAVLAGPRLVAAVRSIRLKKPLVTKSDAMADAHTVLEIASRLKAEGNTKGVELCQSLIDVMLSPGESP